MIAAADAAVKAVRIVYGHIAVAAAPMQRCGCQAASIGKNRLDEGADQHPPNG